jgi:hypothetical protein
VILIGAHPRPTGVILRFEVTLASGVTVLRGEGRVLAHKENAFRGQAGLTLRFTRLDPRSKGVVDRATALREVRAQGEGGSPSRPPAPHAGGPIADALTASTPEPSVAAPKGDTGESARDAAPSDELSGIAAIQAEQEAAVASIRAAAREKANATARANAKRTALSAGLTPPPVPTTSSAREVLDERDEATPVTSIPGVVAPKVAPQRSEPPPTPSEPPGAREPSPPPIAHAQPRAVEGSATQTEVSEARSEASAPQPAALLQAPANRSALLERLRLRAEKLPPERVEEILAQRMSR